MSFVVLRETSALFGTLCRGTWVSVSLSFVYVSLACSLGDGSGTARPPPACNSAWIPSDGTFSLVGRYAGSTALTLPPKCLGNSEGSVVLFFVFC